MEWNLQLNAKPMLDCIDESHEKRLETLKSFTQEIKAILKETFTEILTKFLFPNEVELQLNAEQFIIPSKQGEEQEQLIGIFISNETDLQLTAEHFITQDKSEEQQEKEEDSSENKDYKRNWILLDGKFIYGEEEDLFQEREGWLFYLAKQREEDLIEKKETLTQFKKQFIYGAEEIKKRDLLFGREALLWRFTWLKKNLEFV